MGITGDKKTHLRIVLVFGVLAIFLVVATYFGTKTMSGVRAYITGEGLWSKAQKKATQQLLSYAFTQDDTEYRQFNETLELHSNFASARVAMTAEEPNYDAAKEGFSVSRLDQQDVDLMVWLGTSFNDISYLQEAFGIWRMGDQQIGKLDSLAGDLHRDISSGNLTNSEQNAYIAEIRAIDQKLTKLENAFTSTLSSGAQWVRKVIFWLIVGLGLMLIAIGYIITARHFKEISDLSTKLERLSLVAAKTTDIVIITDSKERIIWVNKMFEEVTGYSMSEIKGKVPGDVLQGEETDPETIREFKEAIEDERSIRKRILNYTKQGKKLWLDITIDPIFNEDGECTNFIAIERNVTEQIKQQAEVRDSLERYNIVARATSDTIYDLDLKNDVIHYNDVIYKMFGYDRTEVENVEKWWKDNIHPDDREKVIRKVDQAMESGAERFQLEYRFKCANNSYKHILDRAFLVTDADGKPLRIIGAMQDISERQEAKKEEEKHRRLLEAITENAALPIWVRNKKGKHILANREWKKLFGLENEKVIGESIYDLLDDTSAASFHDNDLKIINSQETRTFYEQVSIDGEDRYFVTSMFPLINVPGLEEAAGGVAIDITARKEAENQLKKTEKKLREIVENSTNMFYRHTPDHVLTYVSPQSKEFLGCEPEEAMKRWTKFVTDNPVNQKGVALTERAIETGKTQQPFELELKKENGEIIWVEVNEAPITQDGETVAIVGSLTDITKHKQAEKEIKQALKEKETLLAEVHHRVKNNMAVVSGMMQLQAFKEEDTELETKLLDNVARIGTMASIHEHLYQSETFSSLKFSENLKTISDKLIKTMQTAAKVKIETSLETVELNLNQAIPCSLIVSEVVTNSLKHAFTGREQGIIDLLLSEEGQQVKLTIKDDGQGLPDKFNASENDSLGIHLIDKLSKQLGGEYSYRSTEEGTEFKLEFEKKWN